MKHSSPLPLFTDISIKKERLIKSRVQFDILFPVKDRVAAYYTILDCTINRKKKRIEKGRRWGEWACSATYVAKLSFPSLLHVSQNLSDSQTCSQIRSNALKRVSKASKMGLIWVLKKSRIPDKRFKGEAGISRAWRPSCISHRLRADGCG